MEHGLRVRTGVTGLAGLVIFVLAGSLVLAARHSRPVTIRSNGSGVSNFSALANAVGSGKFKATSLPAGFVLDDERDMPVNTPIIDAAGNSSPRPPDQQLTAHVVRYVQSTNRDQVIVVTSVSDPNASDADVDNLVAKGRGAEHAQVRAPRVLFLIGGSSKYADRVLKWRERAGTMIQVSIRGGSDSDLFSVSEGIEEGR